MKKSLFFLCLGLFILSASAQTPWDDYTQTADSLDLENQYEAALTYRTQALQAANNQPDSIQKLLLGAQMFTQAEIDFTQPSKDPQAAYHLMQNAVDTLEKWQADPERMRRVLYRLSLYASDNMYQLMDADKFMNKALAYADKTSQKDTIAILTMMDKAGFVKALLRKFDESIQISEEALQLFEQLNDENHEALRLKAKIYYDLSLVYNSTFLNIPQKEYQYTVEAEKILNKMKDPDIEHVILTYRRLALFERDYKNYTKAKGYMNKAIALYDEHREEMRGRAGFKLELALYRANVVIYIESGEEKGIMETIEKVEDLEKKHSFDEVEKGNYKNFLNYISRYYLSKEDIQQAEKYNKLAQNVILDSRKAPYSLAPYDYEVDLSTITIDIYKEEYQKALDLIVKLEKNQDGYTSRLLYEYKAQAQLGIDNLEEAKQTVHQLLASISTENKLIEFPEGNVEDFAPGNSISDVVKLIHLAASFHKYYGDFSEEEEKLYWMALAQMENNIDDTPLNKDLKKSFDQITSGLMNIALQREFSTEENNRLLSFMDRISSQELITRFLLNREIAQHSRSFELLEEEQYARAYITLLKKQYQQSKDEDLQQEIFEKEVELQKIHEKIAAQYPQNNPFAISQVDISKPNSQNVIKFKVTGDDLFKIQLRKGKLTYQKIADYPALKQEIKTYLLGLSDLNTPVEQLKKQGSELYKKLFDNEFDEMATVIIPDDILHYLPFDILVKDDHYLLENHTIFYASNFYFLNSQAENQPTSQNKKIAFFAPEYDGEVSESLLAVRGESYSLEGATEEVNEISQRVFGNVYKGSAASKSNFKALDKDISVLHLAMHSNLNDEDPELSNLVFSNTEEDFEMYIFELYGMNFNADLAVLSACNTGVGGFKDGGNLVSMHHAFTTAGIPSTVASLWNAPDQSTKELMVSFYNNLLDGKNKAEALQQAKLTYLQDTEDENLQHPFYWAGFVLSGDESPVALAASSSSKFTWIQYVLLGAVVIAFSGWLYYKKRNNDKESIAA